MSIPLNRFLACGVFVALLSGCSLSDQQSTGQTAPRFVVPGVIVQADWLKQQLGNDQLVIVDAREPKEYEAGHIQGAVNVPMSALFVHDPVARSNLLPIGTVQKVLSDAGIDMDHAVVVYDGTNFREAASVFWALEVHGHPSVAVLEGTYGKWVAAGLPTSTVPPTLMKRQFNANLQPQRFATKLAVLRAMEGGDVVILDARSDEEYKGEKSEAARKGHVPHATHIDFKRNLVFDKAGACSLRFSTDLLELYRTNLNDHSKIICYCNTGHRASVSYLALRSLGYDCAVYDGSWLEWGNDDNLPIE